MRGQRDLDLGVDIEPFGVMVLGFSKQRHAVHKAPRLAEIGELERAHDRLALARQIPLGMIGKQLFYFVLGEFGNLSHRGKDLSFACCGGECFCLTVLMMQAELKATDLACRRGDRLLFRKLGFSLAAGEALHITGANGTGKTTLMRALSGLTTPFAGEVQRTGELGLLDERPALDPDQPLGKALGFWNRIDGGADPAEAHAKLGLGALLEVPVRYLSTGQRKRAGLAALIGRGIPIWLLDEPLSGLDVAAIETVTRLIEAHVQGGGIALIASHQALAIEGLKSLELGDYAPRRQEEEEE